MRIPFILAALAGAAILTPAIAQTAPAADPNAPHQELPYDRGYDKPTARADAVNAQEAPVTAGLNGQMAASSGAATQANADSTAANNAQYDADRQAYVDALARHDRAVDRTDRRYARQQRAYADAMAVWRVQVQECRKGHNRACELPPPNVADYY